jgi:hypothetical protein
MAGQAIVPGTPAAGEFLRIAVGLRLASHQHQVLERLQLSEVLLTNVSRAQSNLIKS